MASTREIALTEDYFTPEQSWELEGLPLSNISAVGNPDLLKSSKLGLLCSVKCPSKIALMTHNYFKSLNPAIAAISGFHSPVERGSLRVMLKKRMSVIICSGLSAGEVKIPGTREHLEQGKLLVLSIFPRSYKRLTTQLAYQRNKFVAVLADRMLIPFADRNSKTLELIRYMISKGKSVSTFDIPENSHLFGLGVQRIS